MKATVLLCLLHAAFAINYTWNGPSESPIEGPGTEVCLLDTSSCGCCVMERYAQRVKEYFDSYLEELTTEMNRTKMALDNYRASHSAFSVALNNQTHLNCHGPFNISKVIPYSYVFINEGNAYDPQTGVFTVPISGVYSLSVTIYAINTNNDKCANLHVNNIVVSELRESSSSDDQDSSTIVLAAKLKAGDRVSVNLPSGCVICDDRSHYNTFSGNLLHGA